MNTQPEVNPIPSDLSDRTVTLNLTILSPHEVTLRSCEILGRGFRNRISFSETRFVEDVLVTRLANAIFSCVRSLPDGAHVLSLPDFLVEIPGLVLSGAHLMVMDSKEGVRNAIIRFKDFMGAVNNAFCENIGLQENYASHSEKLAVNVLADICLPILNICRSFEEFCVDKKINKPLEISDRVREFEFQTELLKRFIFNANIGHAKASMAHLNTDFHEPARLSSF